MADQNTQKRKSILSMLQGLVPNREPVDQDELARNAQASIDKANAEQGYMPEEKGIEEADFLPEIDAIDPIKAGIKRNAPMGGDNMLMAAAPPTSINGLKTGAIKDMVMGKPNVKNLQEELAAANKAGEYLKSKKILQQIRELREGSTFGSGRHDSKIQ